MKYITYEKGRRMVSFNPLFAIIENRPFLTDLLNDSMYDVFLTMFSDVNTSNNGNMLKGDLVAFDIVKFPLVEVDNAYIVQSMQMLTEIAFAYSLLPKESSLTLTDMLDELKYSLDIEGNLTYGDDDRDRMGQLFENIDELERVLKEYVVRFDGYVPILIKNNNKYICIGIETD